jgi:hypothetical protein
MYVGWVGTGCSSGGGDRELVWNAIVAVVFVTTVYRGTKGSCGVGRGREAFNQTYLIETCIVASRKEDTSEFSNSWYSHAH